MESSLFAIKTDKGLLAVNLIRDITQQKLEQKKIEGYAFVDPITNLPNRRYFDAAIKHNLLSVSEKRSIGLLFIDVDKFKFINDKYGHSTGDLVLKIIAERLIKSLRGKDVVARIGGDEFIVMVYPLSNNDYLEKIAQRILNVFQDEVTIAKNTLTIHVSIGITATNSADTTSTILVNRADKAMYQAKNTGGNQFYIIF